MADLFVDTCRGEGRVLRRAAVIQCNPTRYRGVRGLCTKSRCNAAVCGPRGSWQVAVLRGHVVWTTEGRTPGVRHYGIVKRGPRESVERPAVFLQHATDEDTKRIYNISKHSSRTATRWLYSVCKTYRSTGVSGTRAGEVSESLGGAN